MTIKQKMLFVGDNPFHGISHLSDDRARSRGNEIFDIDYATKLVISSLENGAVLLMYIYITPLYIGGYTPLDSVCLLSYRAEDSHYPGGAPPTAERRTP